MALRDLWYRGWQKARLTIGLGETSPDAEFMLAPEAKNRLLAASGGELARTFYAHRGRLIHKWTHYLEIYEKHFNALRNGRVRMLEIGVFKGGSLELWREYLGPDATIFGIDVDPHCASRVDPPNQVRIGSQDDPEFLRRVVAEMGGVDLVLDDGSHVGRHQLTSFLTLFPLLTEGGLYVIEDLHTSYWPGFYEGGLRRKGTGVELVKGLIDDMHGWYYRQAARVPAIGALHVYDSIVVMEKRAAARPQRIMVAGTTSD